jgi:hypothetical protein
VKGGCDEEYAVFPVENVELIGLRVTEKVQIDQKKQVRQEDQDLLSYFEDKD